MSGEDFKSVGEQIRALDKKLLAGRNVIVEIGPGAFGGTYSVDLEAAKDPNALYVAIDPSKDPLSKLKVPADLKMSVAAAQINVGSDEFLKSDLFEGSVDTLYAFNVFGEPRTRALRDDGNTNESLKKKDFEIVRRFSEMLKPGKKIVIGEWYAAEYAQHFKDFPFASIGLEKKEYIGREGCAQALRENGFTEGAAERMQLMSVSSGHPDRLPFVLVLEKRGA